MTVNVYPGPGTSAHQSTQYSVTVNGSTAYVYGWSRTAPIWTTVQGWSAGESPYQSWVTWGADETVTVVVTRLAGPITSCRVYPTEDGITKSIAGGVLTLTVPANRRLQVEMNGNERDWLWLFSSPPITIPGGTTNWSTYGPRTVSSVSDGANTLTVASGHGLVANERVRFYTTGTYPTAVGGDLTEADFYYVTNPLATTIQLSRTSGGSAIDITSTGSGTMQVYRTVAPSAPLYFPAGSWRIGRLFDMQDGFPVYLDGSAHVFGTFDLRACTAGSDIIGHGVIGANLSTWEVIVALPSFSEQLEWSTFHGLDTNYNRDNRLEGVTFYGHPFYSMSGYEFTEIENVQVLGGWAPNADGFDAMQKSTTDNTASIRHCLCWCGDDSLKISDDFLRLTVDDVYCVQSASSAILVDYFGNVRVEGFADDATIYSYREFSNIYARSLQVADYSGGVDYPTNALIKAWVDSTRSDYGAWDLRIDGFHAVGDLQVPVISFEVKPYPWADAGTEKGQVAFFSIRNVTTETTPAQLSRILGRSWEDTPHDIELSSFEIGGVRLTAANFAEFFERNVYPYNLFVEGQPVVTAVDLCNRALAYIGESPYITSIAPPDDTKPAKLCARFFWQAFNEVAQGHEWAWSTTRAALVEVADGGNETWRYCYEIPAGMLRCIEVMPKGGYDGFRDQSGDRTRYRIERDAGGIQRIYSNLSDAWIRYSVYVTDPNLLDPWAQEAVALNLAAKLVAAITQGGEGRRNMVDYLQLANAHIARAKANDGNQRVTVAAPAAGVPWLGEGRA